MPRRRLHKAMAFQIVNGCFLAHTVMIHPILTQVFNMWWRVKPNGYSDVLAKVGRELWAFPTDYTTRKPSFKSNLTASFLSRAERKTDSM